ncbi:uncharacterized protein LOC144649408 isoform X1 [Oculina patagonica]
MGCGPSKTPGKTTVSGGASGKIHAEPSPVNDNASAVRTVQNNNLAKKPSGAVPEITKSDAGNRTVEERNSSVRTNTETKSTQMTILHFNDVYNIEPREKEPVGGAARFATKVASLRHLNPLIVFSGDCLNPSTMSSVTSGKQMIPILNALNVNIAVYGNHDFDFGVDELMEFSVATNCPWLLSNVIDKMTERQLADGEIKRIIEWGGRKIGFMGLVEEEWLVTLATVDREEVTYLDFVTEGTKLAKELREVGAEFVVALTHMRGPNDRRLAEKATGIDLILGGHDHDYFAEKINDVHVIKSGTDFREFSCITVNFNKDNSFTIDVQKVEITSDIPEDPEVKATVDKYVGVMNDMMEEVIGEVEVELDGRFSSIRTKETNLGNFVTDIIQNVTEVDCVILNSGTLRSDTIHHPGKFKMKDLSSILPMSDVLVVLELTGDQILQALENGVSQWPKLEGRFPQVAGIRFSFNPSQDPGCRILENTVSIDDKPLDKKRKYKVCTKSYLAKGKDGYQVFAKARVLVDEEDGPILNTIVRNHFRSINIVRGVTKSKSSHRQSLIMRSKECLISSQDAKENGCDTTQHVSWRHRSSNMIDDGARRSSQEFFLNLEKEHTSISPQVEGRIIMATEENEGMNSAASNSEDVIVHHTVQVELTESRDNSKMDEPAVGSDHSEQDKSPPDDPEPTNTEEEGRYEENAAKQCEQNDNSKKDKADEEDLSPSDKPTGQVQVDQTEDTVKENHESAADESIKEDEQEHSQTSQEEGNNKDLPSTTEGSGVSVEQGVDDSLQLGPDMATEDEYWNLWEAVKVDDIDLVKNLRQEKNIRFTRFQDNKTILHLGAERNSVKVVTFLLTEGKLDPNVKDEILQGVPLHGAAEYGSVDAARTLLEHGAEVNKQDLIGNTALHIACEHEQSEMKTFLVEQGADTTVVNSDGETPAV